MQSDLICPWCGSRNNTIGTLMSQPPQHAFECQCGYRMQWDDRELPCEKITQQELNFICKERLKALSGKQPDKYYLLDYIWEDQYSTEEE